jgi:hypothetical protein
MNGKLSHGYCVNEQWVTTDSPVVEDFDPEKK